MKKIITLVAIALGFFLSCQYSFIMSNSSVAPVGYSGSMVNSGHTCAIGNSGCHGGGATGAVITYTFYNAGTTTPATTYQPGATYDIMVNVSGTVNVTPKYGFEMTAETHSPATVAGTFAANVLTDVPHTFFQGSSHYVTHHTANAATQNWYFSWTAPATNAGTVFFLHSCCLC